MSDIVKQQRLLSHNVSPEIFEKTLSRISDRIIKQGDKPYVTVERQLELLEQLSQFDFGRFLLQNQGINGYWTHYLLTYPWFGQDKAYSELEKFLLSRAPVSVATQQRFQIFLREIQKHVKNHAKLACIPCGMMGELLYLNYDGIQNIELVGIDYDSETFKDAAILAEKQNLTPFVKFLPRDAWHLGFENEFDLISSNGLNIYESNDDKVTELYSIFYKALKHGGKLVTSFITPPPGHSETCEWDLSTVNPDDLLLSRIVYSDIINAKWQGVRSSEKTLTQLNAAGFCNIEIIYDSGKMFPTVIAFK